MARVVFCRKGARSLDRRATRCSALSGVVCIVCLAVWTSTLSCGRGSISSSTSNPAPKDFGISVSPSTVMAAAGSSSSTFAVTTTGENGFSDSVTITISGLPAGATTSPASPFSMPASKSQTVTLSVPTSTGNFQLTVTGAAGSLSHSASLTLTIKADPDFSVGVSPAAITAVQGSTSSGFTVTTAGLNGFNGSVNIAISGLPAGAATTPASPFSLVAGSSQNVSLSMPTTVTPGSYSVVLNGTSGSLTHSSTLTLTVPSPDFSIGLSPPAVTANAGTSTSSFNAVITEVNGFNGSVNISLFGLPTGTTTSPSSPFSVSAGGNQVVTLTVPATAVTGDYTVTASGTSGSLTHSMPLDLTILGVPSITTWHYDNARTGANLSESILTPANVNSTNFGKLATYPVDGFVVGHPLYLRGVNILGQGVHNVVYAATMHDSVYAFDADSANTAPLWSTSILSYSPPGATSVPTSVTNNALVTGWSEMGIVSTPVIDPTAGILYLVAETYENGSVVHRLHALDVASGQETASTTITATYSLNGTTTTFQDLYQMNRPGLLLANGHIYIGFGSNCCNAYSQGWLLSYNAGTLQQEGAYTTEPGGTLASIWQRGAGISADSNGNIYAETGEGEYVPGTKLSTSVLKLRQTGSTLELADWFTPYNYQYLSKYDLDLSNGVVILPDQPGPYPHEMVTLGKEGVIYVLNRDNLGQLCPPTTCSAGDTQIVQEFPQGGGRRGNTPAYWNNTLYFTNNSSPVTAYRLSNGTLVVPPAAQSVALVDPTHPMITADGNSNGILWLIDSGTRLTAMDAITLKTLYVSKQASGGRDSLPPLAHFASPIAADGKVFIGTQNSVVAYGLFSGTPALTARQHRSLPSSQARIFKAPQMNPGD